MPGYRRVVVEADGGSRGNPGPAAYGALIRDADTGQVIAESAEAFGTATNNVAEYKGLIAGLELVREHAPDAEVEVRMDSKLVIEQMAGRWRVKHPDMKPLAMAAQRIAPFGVEWTWVPREQNKAADEILNVALDVAQGRTPKKRRTAAPEPQQVESETGTRNPMAGWRDPLLDPPTTILLLRHGVTDSTVNKLFCGTGGADPGLNDAGRAQAARAAAWIAAHGGADAIVSSPLARTRETAAAVGDALGLDVGTDDDLAEAAFGEWDGLTFAQVQERWPSELDAWLESTATPPPGGEAYDSVFTRARRARNRLVRDHGGRTVVVVSHVTPIKMLARLTLDVPMPVIHRLELEPASISTVRVWPDGLSTLRGWSFVPE
ncbi:bifunctional RNase H/acid phosphatase [Solicola sp. PLA-1-18]|uniref:bifunctional RNase H/acid phosphatase n=1 Tax=Solicola sp. PLA-1-18 TaxID=3380532 RepID=UPI003B79D2C5